MNLLLVCGPWSSGTTAVAGVLARLGAIGLQPTFHTFDSRTGDSYESMAFRDLVQSLASESSLTLLPQAEGFAETELTRFRERILKQEFGPYDPRQTLFLKYPLSALAILPICKVFNTRLVYVVRPFADIEATRRRRDWPEQYGEQGAARIYAELFRLFVTHTIPTLMVRYTELLAAPTAQVERLAEFGGLARDSAAIAQATAFLQR